MTVIINYLYSKKTVSDILETTSLQKYWRARGLAHPGGMSINQRTHLCLQNSWQTHSALERITSVSVSPRCSLEADSSITFLLPNIPDPLSITAGNMESWMRKKTKQNKTYTHLWGPAGSFIACCKVWTSQVVQQSLPARCKRQEFKLWVRKIPWRRKWKPS